MGVNSEPSLISGMLNGGQSLRILAHQQGLERCLQCEEEGTALPVVLDLL